MPQHKLTIFLFPTKFFFVFLLIILIFFLILNVLIDFLMQPETLLKHSAELLRIIFKSNTAAADNIASDYFRSKKYIGANDRRFISEVLFHTLRNLIYAHKLATEAINTENNLSSIFRNEVSNKQFELFSISLLLLSNIQDFPIHILPTVYKLTDNGATLKSVIGSLALNNPEDIEFLFDFVWDYAALRDVHLLTKESIEAYFHYRFFILEKILTTLNRVIPYQ